MRLRIATTRDLHRLTEITTTSLIDDPTYDYLSPRRREFPEDNWTWMRLKLESLLYSKRSTFLVIEIDGDGKEKAPEASANYQAGTPPSTEPCTTIISYGIWVRMGNDERARKRFAAKNTWLNMLDGKCHPSFLPH